MEIPALKAALQKHMLETFETRRPLFKKIERLLQKEIKTDPRNISAVSLLAMVKCELRQRTDTSLKYLKSAYDEERDHIAADDFCLLATNYAYFLIEECFGKEKLAADILWEAVKRKSPYYQTYFALAKLLYKGRQFDEALPLFKKTATKSQLIHLQYNYAICLFKTGDKEGSIQLLRALSAGYNMHEYNTKAYFALGIAYSYFGMIASAKKVADDLFITDYESFDINKYSLADLMYCVGEYSITVELYDSEKLYATADWLRIYFYCLRELGQEEKAKMKYSDILRAVDDEIASMSIDDFVGNEGELKDYLQREAKRRDSIVSAYESAFTNGIKPDNTYDIDLIYGCYYIDCPRHTMGNIQYSV